LLWATPPRNSFKFGTTPT